MTIRRNIRAALLTALGLAWLACGSTPAEAGKFGGGGGMHFGGGGMGNFSRSNGGNNSNKFSNFSNNNFSSNVLRQNNSVRRITGGSNKIDPGFSKFNGQLGRFQNKLGNNLGNNFGTNGNNTIQRTIKGGFDIKKTTPLGIGRQDISRRTLEGLHVQGSKGKTGLGGLLSGHVGNLGGALNGNLGKLNGNQGKGNVVNGILGKGLGNGPLGNGGLGNLGQGNFGRKLRLGDQFKMFDKGDVARRLGLHQNFQAKDWAKDFHGLLSPSFAKNCSKGFYCGPSHCPSHCWYPGWNGWVNWCWNYHCDPLWDPRPLCCRPIVFDPCGPWVWWNCPTWQPLPVVLCGTWVDVPPVVVTGGDLQLLAVRLVDGGFPEKDMGPRFRVWFRNNSPLPLEQPFSVMVMAANGDQPQADLPSSGARLSGMAAGVTQSVDLRLPASVAQMGQGPDGQPMPFSMLHVMVDSGNEVVEATEANNGAVLPRSDVPLIDPAVFGIQVGEGQAEPVIELAGEGLGPAPGKVLIQVSGLELEGEIMSWHDLGVQVKLPQLQLTGPAEAAVVLVRGDGAAANSMPLNLQPGN